MFDVECWMFIRFPSPPAFGRSVATDEGCRAGVPSCIGTKAGGPGLRLDKPAPVRRCSRQALPQRERGARHPFKRNLRRAHYPEALMGSSCNLMFFYVILMP